MTSKSSNNTEKVLHKELSFRLCGLLYEVHNKLGRYKNEKQYADYLESLLKKEKIAYEREVQLKPSFEGEMERRNVCDFIIEGKVIIELKNKRFLAREDYLQTKRYLTSSKLDLAILVNFSQKYLTPKRILNGELIH